MDLERFSGSGLPETEKNSLVLVIDSNADSLWLASQILDLCGYSSLSTTKGLEALEIVQQKRPSLILSELMLTDIDGIELIKQLRKMAIATPIVAVTTLWQSPYLELAVGAGCNGLIKKPYEVEELMAIAATHLPLLSFPF
ncbi:response regulator [Leptolyngbya sp. FACHB-671]|uniref:response regulator n=1 Tax=Leptolyngbya sp. FACHB-671 TaxID=2692812 RepID=UPI0016851D11|nr:response regulator [Leptolyngbya sp. FACHB-671]MBD2071537.1 response regulator [Leptolyngbya sp. FACHB-671]